MGVDKVIVRAFFSTLLAIVILFAFMLLSLVCLYPQTMMEITYNLGMETPSIWFAEKSYERSDDVYYIAYATEVAIEQSDYEKIDVCGERFVKDEGFGAYCAAKNAKLPEAVTSTYEQYVYGQLCVAKYERGKSGEAIECAFAFTGTAFPKNNAVVALLVTALKDGDTQTAEKIKGKMEQMQNSIPQEDKAYFEEVLGVFARNDE